MKEKALSVRNADLIADALHLAENFDFLYKKNGLSYVNLTHLDIIFCGNTKFLKYLKNFQFYEYETHFVID